MKVAVLGTGMVGRAHAARLVTLGHEVMMGTQDVEKTMASQSKDMMGNPPFSEWATANPQVKVVKLAEAAAAAELIIEAISGQAVVKALKQIEKEIGTKVVIDISNSLDFSKGMPPTLSVCNTDSLGEQLQKALPQARIIKTLNTTNAAIQVDPMILANGDHHCFMSGNDAGAKKTVEDVLRNWYGWKNVLDLGDITTSRGVEMSLPLWLSLMGSMQNAVFNYKIVIN